jgi:hypothetical protein
MNHRMHHAAVLSGLLLAGLAQSGCALLAYPFAAFRGPETQPAAYDLKQHAGGKVVVWVRAIPEELEARDVPVRDLLGRGVTAKLKVDAKLDVVSYAQVERLFRSAPSLATTPPRRIGQKLGASKVLYVDVRRFAVRDAPDSTILRGQLHATVAVIDVDTGEQDWPVGGEGHSISHEQDAREPERRDQDAEVGDRVIADVAEQIARLFYDYTPPE